MHHLVLDVISLASVMERFCVCCKLRSSSTLYKDVFTVFLAHDAEEQHKGTSLFTEHRELQVAQGKIFLVLILQIFSL